MPEMKRVLVVSGDYSLIHQARLATQMHDFALQTAYSHKDGMYALTNGDFDAAIVDATMTSRTSGEYTLETVALTKPDMPVIALTNSDHITGDHELPSNVIVGGQSEFAILQSLSNALHIPFASAVATSAVPLEASQVNGSGRESADEIEALFSLSKSLTEVLELSEVLNRVVEAARHLTDAEEGMILLPDEEGGQLYLRAKVGIDVEVARNFRIKTEDTLAGRVFASGQPVLIGAQGPLKVKTEYLVNSLLYVPIIYETKCIGVLGVNNRSSEALFLPRHQELLQNLASFAAIAIENAGVHEETVERTRELQTLVEASQILNSSLSLEKTLPNICEQLMRIANVNLAEIYEWDRETNQLRTVARSFRTIWYSGQGPVFEFTQRPLLQAALEEKRALSVSITNVDEMNSEVEYLRRLGTDTTQVLPIIGGSQTVGILQFFYVDRPHHLPNSETLQRIQHMILEMLVTLSNQTQGRSQGVFRTVEDINRLAGADWCEVDLLRPDQKSLSVNLVVGKALWSAPPQPCLDLARYPDIAEAIESHTPIVKQSESKIITPGIRALFDVLHSRAIMGLPLIQRGQAQGLVVFADARRNRVFSERDMDMGRAIVGQAATAIENARLVYDLERSLADLKEAQGRLVQTARLSAMGELAAAVAHQINNPLTTIMVDSELILLDENPEGRNYRSLQSINRAGKRAAGVARRLLAIARPNDPETPPERIDVLDTIDGVLSLVKSHIERDRIQIVSELPGSLPNVLAVPGQLDDIWLNLLMNAHDALIGRPGATIGINAAEIPDDGFIEVVVWDNGPGIPDKIKEEIFKPFFTTKPVGEGTGLGLHICRQTAERAGGSISVESNPGAGTQFLVRLPANKRGDIEL